MTQVNARRFYRVVRSNPPSAGDFRSYEGLGAPAPSDDPDVLRRWRGVSVFDTREAAAATARQRTRLGTFIAELRIADGSSIVWEKTGRAHHYTVWATPEELLSAVGDVTGISDGSSA